MGGGGETLRSCSWSHFRTKKNTLEVRRSALPGSSTLPADAGGAGRFPRLWCLKTVPQISCRPPQKKFPKTKCMEIPEGGGEGRM